MPEHPSVSSAEKEDAAKTSQSAMESTIQSKY